MSEETEKMTAIERLEEMLNERDSEIEDLSTKLADAERAAEFDHVWTKHIDFKNDTHPSPELPIPRLEIRWVGLEHPVDGYSNEARYSLVYRHLLGHVVFVPLGLTRSSGDLVGRLRWDNVELPFRDGAHFSNEMRQFGLRGFAIVGDTVQEMFICNRCGRLNVNHRSDWRECSDEPMPDWSPK